MLDVPHCGVNTKEQTQDPTERIPLSPKRHLPGLSGGKGIGSRFIGVCTRTPNGTCFAS